MLLRVLFVLIFLGINVSVIAQKKALKKTQTACKQINILTAGLDDFVLEKSETNFIEVFLFAENPNQQHIVIKAQKEVLEIQFKIPVLNTEEHIFRKYITKRLQRASAIIKIPKNKKVYVFGENIDIESKSIDNELAIYIENGIVKLNTISAKTTLKLYSGNVYALTKKTKLALNSKNGKIEIDGVLKDKQYKETPIFFNNELNITTIKGNLFLKTE